MMSIRILWLQCEMFGHVFYEKYTLQSKFAVSHKVACFKVSFCTAVCLRISNIVCHQNILLHNAKFTRVQILNYV